MLYNQNKTKNKVLNSVIFPLAVIEEEIKVLLSHKNRFEVV
jgi:hypothetical protein